MNLEERLPSLLKERTFRVVFVSPCHGAGMAAEEKADAAGHYTSKTVTVTCTQ